MIYSSPLARWTISPRLMKKDYLYSSMIGERDDFTWLALNPRSVIEKDVHFDYFSSF
jgi:hypothetical protein